MNNNCVIGRLLIVSKVTVEADYDLACFTKTTTFPEMLCIYLMEQGELWRRRTEICCCCGDLILNC